MNHSHQAQAVGFAERFQDLLGRYGIESGVSADIYEIVRRHYDEPHRHYHNLDHIQHCLAQLDSVADDLDHPDFVELALWFHDVIYEISSEDNEIESAALFDRLVGIHLPEDVAKQIHSLILVTIHPSTPEEHDAQYMVDIDLSSFGASWEEFFRDSQSLREENGHKTEQEYTVSKLNFLNKLLARPRFFLTDHFERQFGAQAMANIKRHIAEVEQDIASAQNT